MRTQTLGGRWLLPALGVTVLLVLWQVVGAGQLLGRSIPPLTEVIGALGSRGDVIWRATLATGQRALLGGLAGFALGVLLASVTAWLPRSTAPVLRSAVLINAIPVVAVGPVLMSLSTRPFIPEIFAGLSVLFSTVLAVSDGLRTASPSSEALFSVYGARRSTRFRLLLFPSALPMVADALRLAVPAALLGAILGEWFGADRGLGVVMVSAMRNVQYGLLWAAALAAIVVSVVFYAIATALERAASARFARGTQAPSPVAALRRGENALLGLAIPVALVLLWQIWVWVGHVPQIVAPQPAGVGRALVTDFVPYLEAAALTTVSALGGLVSGAIVGIGLAVLVSVVPWLYSMLSPLALIIPTVPIVVFIPIIGGLLGYGMQTVFASCVLMAFFPIYVLALSGLRSRPPGADDVFAVHGAGRWQRLIRLSLPSSVPTLLLAVRISAANCFLIAISAEWLMGQGGLGRLFSERRVVLDNDGSWAAVIVAVALSVAAYVIAAAAERRVSARWQS